MQQILRDLHEVVHRHVGALEHGDDVSPGQLRLGADIRRYLPARVEPRGARGEKPARIRGRLHRVAVGSDLPSDADVVDPVDHGLPSPSHNAGSHSYTLTGYHTSGIIKL